MVDAYSISLMNFVAFKKAKRDLVNESMPLSGVHHFHWGHTVFVENLWVTKIREENGWALSHFGSRIKDKNSTCLK